jgi:hypothetical protein
MSDPVANFYSGPTNIQIGRGSRQLGGRSLDRIAVPIWKGVKQKIMDLAPVGLGSAKALAAEGVGRVIKKSDGLKRALEKNTAEPAIRGARKYTNGARRRHKRSRVAEALGDDTY